MLLLLMVYLFIFIFFFQKLLHRLFPFGIDFTCRFFVDVVNDILIAHFRHQFFGCRSLRFGYTQQRKEKGKDQHNNEGHKRIGCQGGI